jgi:protein FAM32A
MGSDDYITPGGGLKLKGSKPLGVEKKKKKKSSSSKKPREGSPSSGSSSKTLALQKALEDEDAEMTRAKAAGEPEGGERELEERDLMDGKTPAERQAEEMRRKRVCHNPLPLSKHLYLSLFISVARIISRLIYRYGLTKNT